MADYPKITFKKHTFLSSVVLGISALAITIIICCTVVIIYGVHFAGERSEDLVSLVEGAVKQFPDLRQALPPALADVLDDRRQPDYAAKLHISAKTTFMPDQQRTARTSIEVVNEGSEVVSLLSLRVVVFAPNGQILAESNEWAATPIAADQDWRGLLMPGSHRHFLSCRRSLSGFFADDLTTEVEITDVRVWNGPKESPLIEDEALEARTTGLSGEVQRMKVVH